MLPETHRAVADLFTGDRAALNASARAAGYAGTLPTRVVLAGHSLGGGLVTGVTRYLVELGATDALAGVVMLDGVSSLDYMSADLEKIPVSIPVYNLSGRPYGWNAFGDTNVRLAQARPGMFTGVELPGGGHADAMQSSSPTIQMLSYLATGYSSPGNVAANDILAAGWINDLFAGTHTPNLYGPPGSPLTIIGGSWTTLVNIPFAQSSATMFGDGLNACPLNPTTPLCGYPPWLQWAHWFDPMIVHHATARAA